MKMGIVDQQLKSNDCGVSAIKIIFSIFGKEIDRNYIQSKIFLDESGSSLKDIKKFFDSNGCKSSFKFLDISLLHQRPELLKPLFPFILPVKRVDRLHFVVVAAIKKNKLKVYDPARNSPYYLSFTELRAIAHYADSYWELIDFKDRIESLCATELSHYNLSTNGSLTTQDPIHTFNKLVYFSHVRDNYGFKDHKTEKLFLEDILHNQDIPMLPRQFRQLKYEKAKVKLSAPMVLSVKSLPER